MVQPGTKLTKELTHACQINVNCSIFCTQDKNSVDTDRSTFAELRASGLHARLLNIVVL